MESQYAELGSVRKILGQVAQTAVPLKWVQAADIVYAAVQEWCSNPQTVVAAVNAALLGAQFGNDIHGGERRSCSNRRHSRAWTRRGRG